LHDFAVTFYLGFYSFGFFGCAALVCFAFLNRPISHCSPFVAGGVSQSVCSGTVTDEAVTIPIREFTTYKALPILDRIAFMWRGYLPDRVRYLYASASDIDLTNKTVQCEYQSNSIPAKQKQQRFPLPYDVLVLGTGATTNTFNTQGVNEYCHYLKETGDATLIRQTVLENLEMASLPNITEEERRQLLSFWVVGGGPTAVEFAAELQDFLVHDVVNPRHATFSRCAGSTSVTLVQSNPDGA
jgi:NADH:ubiquinone reductase (non-electrogenic)